MSKRKNVFEIKEEFIEKHGDKYDYSLITDEIYKNSSTKLPIICHNLDFDGNEHGIFYQDRKHHLRGHGCPKCAKSGIKYTNESFIKMMKHIHPNLLFDMCDYKNSHTPIIVGCKKHGYFNIPPYYLTHYKFGCPKCGNSTKSSQRLSNNDEFIEKANKKYGYKYDYSKVDYYRSNVIVTIICHNKDKNGNEHGEFYQTPNTHLMGSGCPKCQMSLLESKIYCVLNENSIKNEYEKKFDWLGNQSLDFYLPEYNIAIECQGTQHYFPSDFGSNKKTKEEMFEYVIKCDRKKYELCKEHGIDIIYFSRDKKQKTVSKQHISSVNVLLKVIKRYDRVE